MSTTHAPNPCTHGMPKPECCFECMEEGNLAPPPGNQRLEVERGPYLAKYDGTCPAPGCGDRILKNSHQVVTMSNREYWHAACAGIDDAWTEM